MTTTPARITSIDAFRGFVMFLMLAEAMRFATAPGSSVSGRRRVMVAQSLSISMSR